jgi:hypothetical protein
MQNDEKKAAVKYALPWSRFPLSSYENQAAGGESWRLLLQANVCVEADSRQIVRQRGGVHQENLVSASRCYDVTVPVSGWYCDHRIRKGTTEDYHYGVNDLLAQELPPWPRARIWWGNFYWLRQLCWRERQTKCSPSGLQVGGWTWCSLHLVKILLWNSKKVTKVIQEL